MSEKFPFSVGSVTFNQGNFEAPNGLEGGLSDLGSKQKASVKEFPGGIVTAQLFGSYPKLIKWTGKMFGANAHSRSLDLQKLCDDGDFITLNYSQWSYEGFVEDYSATAISAYEIHYSMSFRPLQNNTAVSGGNAVVNNDPFQSTVNGAQQTMVQQAMAPSSGASLPAPVQTATVTLNKAVNSALQTTGGKVSSISQDVVDSLQQQISSLQALLAPLVAGSDPQVASSAADLNSTVSVLSTSLFNATNKIITQLQIQSPNLYQLATQFYGDPALYDVIQDFPQNSFADPLAATDAPITVYIPVLPPNNDTAPPTVVAPTLAA